MTAPHSHAGSPGRGQFSPQPAPRMEAVLTVAPQATLHLGGRPLHPLAEAGQGRPAGCREGGSVSDRHRSRIPAPFLTSRGDEGLRLPAALLCWLGTSTSGLARRANPDLTRGRAHGNTGRGLVRARAVRWLNEVWNFSPLNTVPHTASNTEGPNKKVAYCPRLSTSSHSQTLRPHVRPGRMDSISIQKVPE